MSDGEIAVLNLLDTKRLVAGVELEPHGAGFLPLEEAKRFRDHPGLEFWWDAGDDPDAYVFGTPFSVLDGYGAVGINLLLELDRRGQKIFPVMVGWDRPPHFPARVHEMQAEHRHLHPRWGVAHGYPGELRRVPAGRLVLWTMWESDRLPDNWKDEIHEGAVALIVPSSAQIDIFQKSGIELPIYVMPDNVNPDVFTPYDRPARDTFTFATWARMSSRKCPMELLECFWRAFPAEPDVRLIIKTHHGHFGGGQVGRIPAIKDKRVTIIDSGEQLPDWSPQQMAQLAHQADAGVFLSAGEGFYCGPIEAMFTGLPTIVPTHTGPADYADEAYNYPVRTAGTETSPMGTDMLWWVMDFDQVSERMREIYENRTEAKARGLAASREMRRRYTPAACADRFLDVWHEIRARDLAPLTSPEDAIPTASGAPIPDVSVLLLAHNMIDRTRHALTALEQCGDRDYELILIDNGSSDGTAELFDQYPYQKKIVLHTGQNLSFSAANNLAAKSATGNYVVLLNNDCYVHPGCLSAMRRAFLRDPQIGAVGALLLYPGNRRVQHAGGYMLADGRTYHHAYHERASHPDAKTSRYTHFCTGACLMVSKELYGLDERYAPGGMEDVDLCLTLRDRGHGVWYEATAVADHDETATFYSTEEFTQARLKANVDLWERFKAKWGPKKLRELAHL